MTINEPVVVTDWWRRRVCACEHWLYAAVVSGTRRVQTTAEVTWAADRWRHQM